MPLGQPGRLTDQEAWDVALFINSQERPQDPRYTGKKPFLKPDVLKPRTFK